MGVTAVTRLMQKSEARKSLTWILPILAIIGAFYFRIAVGGLESAADTPVWKTFFLNWLVPIISLRFLWKRDYEPRTLLWLLPPAILFTLPVVFIFALMLLVFSITQATRKVGLVIFFLMLPFLAFIGLFSPFLTMPAIRLPEAHIYTGARDVYLYSMGQGVFGDDFDHLDSRQKLLPGIVIANYVDMSAANGRIDNIEVIDGHHIRYRVDTYSADGESVISAVKTVQLR